MKILAGASWEVEHPVTVEALLEVEKVLNKHGLRATLLLGELRNHRHVIEIHAIDDQPDAPPALKPDGRRSTGPMYS